MRIKEFFFSFLFFFIWNIFSIIFLFCLAEKRTHFLIDMNKERLLSYSSPVILFKRERVVRIAWQLAFFFQRKLFQTIYILFDLNTITNGLMKAICYCVLFISRQLVTRTLKKRRTEGRRVNTLFKLE